CGTSTSVDCFAAQDVRPRPTCKLRSLVLRPAISLVSINPKGPHDHPSRDPRALASSRLSPLLALEVTIIGRAAADRDRTARADPADGGRKSSLGCATHPRRTSQARV